MIAPKVVECTVRLKENISGAPPRTYHCRYETCRYNSRRRDWALPISDAGSMTGRRQMIKSLSPPRRVHILGARVDDVTWDETLDHIAAYIASGEPHHVMTPNPEFVMRARRDPAFQLLLDHADLAPADGVGVKWAARLLGERLREVVPGSDLVERLAAAGMGDGQRWFLLGAAEGVAAEAAVQLQSRYPGLQIVGTWSGAPDPEQDDDICRRIEAVRPVDLLLVAYGAPRQDEWIARNQPRLRIPVAIGVGGTLDFIAGRSRRPPRLIKRLNLIWLFRLVTEPWRWRRQRALVRFAALVLWQSLRRRRTQ
jgi:N-acetylglucosaminyldiphosphoundecaprenol N-acetyl-beta-D-mannosaminyltransferase